MTAKKHKRGSIDIGPLSPTKEGGRWSMPRVELDVPTRVTNYSMPAGSLVLPKWQIRGGGDQHLNYRSLG